MNRENLLTARWNNILSLTIGIPVLVYAVLVLTNSSASEFSWFVGMFVIGSLF